MIKVEVVGRSKNTFGQTLSSVILTYPRFIHSELMTHRVFTRNAASSRAIPAMKMLRTVMKETFIPKAFQKNHKGMQGNEYISGNKLKLVTLVWLLASKLAGMCAWMLIKLGVTKQITNRLLEPFQWYTVLVSSTEWENFLALRAHDQAEIHIQEVAYKVLETFNRTEPQQLKADEWHVPFGDRIDEDELEKVFAEDPSKLSVDELISVISKRVAAVIKVATARCARLSYMTLGSSSKIDYAADIRLHDSLVGSDPKHASPAEHPAKGMNKTEFFNHSRTFIVKTLSQYHQRDIDLGITHTRQLKNNAWKVTEYGWCGNFRGFIQYRKFLENENQTDNRLTPAA